MTRRTSAHERALVEAALDVSGRDTGGGRRRAPCPLCEAMRARRDTKLSIYMHADGGWTCFRCGAGGWMPWADRSKPREKVTLAHGDGLTWRSPPPGFVPLIGEDWEPDDPAFDAHRAYLRHRGVDPSTAKALFFGAVPTGYLRDHVIAPVLDETTDPPTWNGWVARRLHPSDDPFEPVYREPPGAPKGSYLYRQSALRQPSGVPVLIVEGVFDSTPFYPNAAATLTKTTPRLFRLIVDEARASGRPVVFVPDGDAWRLGDAYAMAARAEGIAAGSLRLPPRVDPDEINPDVIVGAAYESLDAAYPVPVGDHAAGL